MQGVPGAPFSLSQYLVYTEKKSLEW